MKPRKHTARDFCNSSTDPLFKSLDSGWVGRKCRWKKVLHCMGQSSVPLFKGRRVRGQRSGVRDYVVRDQEAAASGRLPVARWTEFLDHPPIRTKASSFSKRGRG